MAISRVITIAPTPGGMLQDLFSAPQIRGGSTLIQPSVKLMETGAIQRMKLRRVRR